MATIKGHDLLLKKVTVASAEVIKLTVSGTTSSGGSIVLSNLVGGESDQTIDTTGDTPTACATAIQVAMNALTNYSATSSGASVTITSTVNGEQEINFANASTELKIAAQTIISGATAATDDIAFAVSTTLNVNANLLDASVKQTAGWLTQCAAQRSWDISAEHLVSLDPTGSDANTSYLFEMMEVGQPVTFEFDETVSGQKFSGAGIVSSLSINAPNEELSTLSISISGTDGLTFV